MTAIISQNYTTDDIKIPTIHTLDDGLVRDPNLHKNHQANIIKRENGVNYLSNANFGFLTPNAQENLDKRYSTHNAQIEKLSTSKLWSKAYLNSHCIVPVNAFYCWVNARPQNTPYMFALNDTKVFYLAGLHNYNQHTKEHGFAVITCTNSGVTKNQPDRLPLVLSENNARNWLEYTLDENAFYEFRNINFHQQEVSRRINKPENKGLRSLYHVT